jgi:hypothetical protein
MPKITWSAFIDRFPATHMVVGVMPGGEAAGTKPRRPSNYWRGCWRAHWPRAN